MKRKRKGRMVWISRDPERVKWEGAQYEIYLRKPRLIIVDYKTGGRAFFGEGLVDTFCVAKFEHITGFTLKQGECKKVRVSIEIVS